MTDENAVSSDVVSPSTDVKAVGISFYVNTPNGERILFKNISSDNPVTAVKGSLSTDQCMLFTTNYDLVLTLPDNSEVKLNDFAMLSEYSITIDSIIDIVRKDYDIAAIKEHITRVRIGLASPYLVFRSISNRALEAAHENKHDFPAGDNTNSIGMTMERITKMRKSVDELTVWPPTWLNTQYPVFRSTSAATLKSKLKTPKKVVLPSEFISSIAFDPASNPVSQSEFLFYGKLAIIRIDFHQQLLPGHHFLTVAVYKKGFRLVSKPDSKLEPDLINLIFSHVPVIKQACQAQTNKIPCDCLKLKWMNTNRHVANPETCQEWLSVGSSTAGTSRDWNEEFQLLCEDGDQVRVYQHCLSFRRYCERDLMSRLTNGESDLLHDFADAKLAFDDISVFGKVFVTNIGMLGVADQEEIVSCARSKLERIDQFQADVDNSNTLLNSGAFYKEKEEEDKLCCVLCAVIQHQDTAYCFQALVPGAVQMFDTNAKQTRLMYGVLDKGHGTVAKKRAFDLVKAKIAPVFHWKEMRIRRWPRGRRVHEVQEIVLQTIIVDDEDEVDAVDDEFMRYYGPFELKCLESRQDGRLYVLDNVRALPHVCNPNDDSRSRCTTFSQINNIQLSQRERNIEEELDDAGNVTVAASVVLESFSILVDVNEGCDVNAPIQYVEDSEIDQKTVEWKDYDARVKAEIETLPLESLVLVGHVLDGKSLCTILDSFGINIDVYGNELKARFANDAWITNLLEIEITARNARDVFFGILKLEDVRTDSGVAVTHGLQVVRRFCQMTSVVLKKDGFDAYTVWDLLDALIAKGDQAFTWVSSIGSIVKSVCPLHPSPIAWKLVMQAEDLLQELEQLTSAFFSVTFIDENERISCMNVLQANSANLLFLLHRANEMFEEVVSCHPDLGRCLEAMAKFGLLIGDLDMALACTQRALSCYEELEGSDSVNVIHLLDDLASLNLQLARQNQNEQMLADAIACLNFAIDTLDVMCGIGHPFTVRLIAKLADLYDSSVQDWDRAMILYDCVTANSANVEEILRCKYAVASIHAMIAVSTAERFNSVMKAKAEAAKSIDIDDEKNERKPNKEYSHVHVQLLVQDSITKMRDVYNDYKTIYGEKSPFCQDVFKRLEWLTRTSVELSNQTGTVVKRIPPSMQDDRFGKKSLAQVFKLTMPSVGGFGEEDSDDHPHQPNKPYSDIVEIISENSRVANSIRVESSANDKPKKRSNNNNHQVVKNDDDDDDIEVLKPSKTSNRNGKNSNNKQKKGKGKKK